MNEAFLCLACKCWLCVVCVLFYFLDWGGGVGGRRGKGMEIATVTFVAREIQLLPLRKHVGGYTVTTAGLHNV